MENYNEKLWGKSFSSKIESFKAELNEIEFKYSHVFKNVIGQNGEERKDTLSNHYFFEISPLPPKFGWNTKSYLPKEVANDCKKSFIKYFG